LVNTAERQQTLSAAQMTFKVQFTADNVNEYSIISLTEIENSHSNPFFTENFPYGFYVELKKDDIISFIELYKHKSDENQLFFINGYLVYICDKQP